MFQRFAAIVIGALMIGTFFLTLGFLWWRSQEVEVAAKTSSPTTRDIVLKTVATGSLVPRTEVELKSRVSGVVAALHVEAGQIVAIGDRIATVRVLPDASSLNNAQGQVQRAQIEAEDARVRRERAEALFASGAISVADRDRAVTEANLAASALRSAQNGLTVVRDGALRGAGEVATEVRSTVAGMVLDVPVELGQSVTESNTFNDGTTVAFVADMADMVFEGFVDESEVGRIREGMPLDLKVGAFRDRRFRGTLEYIAPKGASEAGAVQFEIRAALEPTEGVFIRAGSSANVDIVLQQADEVMAINEANVQYDGDQPFVEVQKGDVYERVDVKLGLSDGIWVEVLEGLSSAAVIKQP